MPLNPFARSHIEDYLHGKDPWAVVTGSTDGIGKETATVLLSKGFNALIHGRNPTKLSETLNTLQILHPKRRVSSVLADFSTPTPENIFAIPSYISSNNLRVTLFINNAAAVGGRLAAFSDMPSEAIDRMLNTGVVFLTKLCHEVIPLMKEDRVGGKAMMVNIGSAAGEYPTPFVSVYSGTKGYLLSFTRILASEALLSSSNITFLYIDVHAVSTPGNKAPISKTSPSAETYARSLVFALGQRKYQGRGGAGVLVTPYWGHKMERVMVGLIPKGMVERITIGKMKALADRRDGKENKNK